MTAEYTSVAVVQHLVSIAVGLTLMAAVLRSVPRPTRAAGQEVRRTGMAR